MARPDHLARRRRALHALPPRRCRGAAQGRRQDRGQEGHPGHLPAEPRDLQDHRVRLRAARASLPRARLPQFGRAAGPGRCAPRRAGSSIELYYEGGIAAFVKYLDRAKTPLFPDPIAIHGQRDDIGIDVALEWNDSYYENVLPFTNNIPQRDGGTHLAAFRAALTRTLNNYADKSGMLKREKINLTGEDMREGPDRDRLGQAARSQVQLADQGQAGHLRSPPAARKPDGRQAGRMAGGESGARPDDHPEDHRRRRRARSRAQGARGQPQVGDGHRLAARQAARLPGTRSRQVRAVPGRGRQRRRLGQAGPRQQVSRRSCRCRARSSTSSARASTGCWRRRKSARSSRRSAPASAARNSTSRSCAITRS